MESTHRAARHRSQATRGGGAHRRPIHRRIWPFALGGVGAVAATAVMLAVLLPPEPAPTTVPEHRVFNPTGLGASVSGAANGDFNRWAGRSHSMYATWADNGKVWSIDSPDSEYGQDSVARLGDYDLDIATQHKIDSWPSPGVDDALEQTFRDIQAKWGTREGHVFIRPFHEFNGNWFNWSVRSRQEQAHFVDYWRRVVHPTFRRVFHDDPRFHLVWSPNRDSEFDLNVRDAFPGSQYVDAIGVDYYDFSRADTEAEWAREEFRTEHGGSPVGIGAWRRFAEEKGLPLYFPEYGVQFGDNAFFIRKVLGYVEEYRYSGDGDPAGRILNAVWHNHRGESPDPSASGDFLVQRGGRDYARRPDTSRAVREWMTSMTWLATPPCSGSACIVG